MEGNKMDDEQSEAFKQWTEDSARKQALANEEIETFEAIKKALEESNDFAEYFNNLQEEAKA